MSRLLVSLSHCSPGSSRCAADPSRPDPAPDLKFATGADSKAEFEKSAATFLAKHCVACHGPKKAEGELDQTGPHSELLV
ncbi:MAG: hypothetical protein FJ304_20640 [Planctomycetes bacterium]|nr:hypothetical protein [Planctomycetota bacterium]